MSKQILFKVIFLIYALMVIIVIGLMNFDIIPMIPKSWMIILLAVSIILSFISTVLNRRKKY